MNYRHAYHAGNFADVVKHVALTRLVEHLKLKDKAFRVIDTHAGAGLYDLSSEEAQKTGEWQGGIGRLLEAKLAPEAEALLGPYLGAVKSANPGGGVEGYPDRRWIVRHLLRSQDRLSAIELHPQDVAALKALFAGDFQARVMSLDGWLALGAHVPPKEKRGLVLVDPPFEEDGEFDRLAEGSQGASALARRHLRVVVSGQGSRRPGEVQEGIARTGIPKILDWSFRPCPVRGTPTRRQRPGRSSTRPSRSKGKCA